MTLLAVADIMFLTAPTMGAVEAGVRAPPGPESPRGV